MASEPRTIKGPCFDCVPVDSLVRYPEPGSGRLHDDLGRSQAATHAPSAPCRCLKTTALEYKNFLLSTGAYRADALETMFIARELVSVEASVAPRSSTATQTEGMLSGTTRAWPTRWRLLEWEAERRQVDRSVGRVEVSREREEATD